MTSPRFVVKHIGWSLKKANRTAKTSQRACLPQRTADRNDVAN